MKKLRIAIIGLGHVARYYIEAIAATPGLELAGASDCDSAKAAILPSGIPFFDDADRMLSGLHLDMAIVAVPNHAHEEMAHLVLNAGLDAVVEKPIASDLATVEALFAFANKCRSRLIPALHAAYGKEVLWLENSLATGGLSELGPVTGFYSGFYDPYVVQGEIVSTASGLGDSWTDSAINALSVIGRFIKPYRMKWVDLTTTRIARGESREVQGSGLYYLLSDDRSVNGWGVINTNWALGLNQKSTKLFFGESGSVVLLDHSAQTVHLYRRDGEKRLLANLDDGLDRLTTHYKGFFSRLVSDRNDYFTDPAYAYALHTLCLGKPL